MISKHIFLYFVHILNMYILVYLNDIKMSAKTKYTPPRLPNIVKYLLYTI